MIITCKINNSKTYRLCSWSAAAFASDPVLMLQTDDLREVKETFDEIDLIEVFISENLVGTYTKYDTYGTISYDGKVFVQHENVFQDCMRVSLIRTSLADEVDRLTELVTPTQNIEEMTTEEYRAYLLKQIGAACRQDIYNGTQVQLPSSGSVELYTYNDDDQRNLTNAMAILIVAPELPSVPYHPSGGLCRMIPAIDLVTIYGTLQLRLTYLTTRCNYMNTWIKSIDSKDALLDINWQTDLPQEYQTQVNEIYSQSLSIVNTIMHKFMPDDPTPSDGDDQEQDTEPTEPSSENESPSDGDDGDE